MLDSIWLNVTAAADVLEGISLPELAAGGSLLVLVVVAVMRVLTFDRDESAVIRAWKERAEAETARADRFDAENRTLRRENRELRRQLDDSRPDRTGRLLMRDAIEDQRRREQDGGAQ